MIDFSKPINKLKTKSKGTTEIEGPEDNTPCWKGME
jgi:hypothetical protein